MDMTQRIPRALIERFCRRYTDDTFVAAYLRREFGSFIDAAKVAKVRASMTTPRIAHQGYTGKGEKLMPELGDNKQPRFQDMMETGSRKLLCALVREHPHAFDLSKVKGFPPRTGLSIANENNFRRSIG